jgi:kynurenine formamidase
LAAKSKYIFLSHELSEKTPGYGGKKGLVIETVSRIKDGRSANQSLWHLSNHLGTHIDAPYHFDNRGRTLCCFTANEFIFKRVSLVDIRVQPGELILPGAWSKNIRPKTDLLLLRTGFEEKRNKKEYWSKNPGLSLELAVWLRKFCPFIKAVGMDFISATSFLHREEGKIAHRAFLKDGKPILLIEDMSLENINNTLKKVIVSPLRVKRSDGSPVTILGEV